MAAAAALKCKTEGNAFFSAKNYEAAIGKYSEAIELQPDNHVFYSNRSASYAALGKWEEAAADGKQCVNLNPKWLKGYHRAGSAMKALGQYQEAIKLVERGVGKVEGDVSALRALVAELRVKYEEAEKVRRSGMRRDELLKNEGNDLYKGARFEDAITKYTEALAACSDKTGTLALSILNNRAACYKQLSNFRAVIEDCSVVLEHDEKNVKALLRRGLAFEGLERYRSALADIRAALAIDPTMKIANDAQHRIGRAVSMLKKEGRRI